MEIAKPGSFLIHAKPSLMKVFLVHLKTRGIKFFNLRSLYVSSFYQEKEIKNKHLKGKYLLFSQKSPKKVLNSSF